MANTPINSTKDHHAVLHQRIDNLEMRNAFQDDVIDQLNTELSTHQEEIANLKDQLKLISGRIKELRPNDGGENELEPPPPHY